jgi:hypothetical protein
MKPSEGRKEKKKKKEAHLYHQMPNVGFKKSFRLLL